MMTYIETEKKYVVAYPGLNRDKHDNMAGLDQLTGSQPSSSW